MLAAFQIVSFLGPPVRFGSTTWGWNTSQIMMCGIAVLNDVEIFMNSWKHCLFVVKLINKLKT